MKKAVVLLSIGLASTPLFAVETTVQVEPAKKLKHKRVQRANQNPAKPVETTAEKKGDEGDKKTEEKKYPWLDSLSGNMAFTSNYVFRGESQSADLPAVQGSLTYTLPLGIYLNVWGSNAKFTGTNASVELDTIVGIKNDIIKDHVTYDINIDRYNYPGAQNLSYNELNSVFNIYFVQLGYSYSANAYASHTTGTYYTGGISTDIPSKYLFGVEDVSLLALIGHSNLSCRAGCAYTDYNVGLSKKFRNYTLTGQWTSTNHGQHLAPIDDSHIIGTLTANF